MASIGSLPFVSETKALSFAILLRGSERSRRRRFPFLSASLPRKGLQSARLKGLRATAKGSEGSESRDEPEDALQATIEKSKKVLALQMDLLQQIAERKKLITTLKSGSVDSGEDDDTDVGDENASIASLAIGDSTSEQEPEIPTPAPSREITESKSRYTEVLPELVQAEPISQWKDVVIAKPSEAKKDLPKGAIANRASPETQRASAEDLPATKVQAEGNTIKQLKVAIPEVEWSDPLPSFLSSTSEVSTRESDKTTKSIEVISDVKEGSSAHEAEPPPLAGANVMNVVIVSAECAPWSKTGGLGDVSGALPKALARRGHRVMVVVPYYDKYTEPQDTGVRKKYNVSGEDCEVSYFQTYIDGVDFIFVDHHMFRNVGNNIYGGNRVDILRRMVLFCKAAVEVPWHVPCGGVCYGDANLAFIANDWHTALLPVYLKAYYRDNGLMTFARSTLVIHNIAHQGRGPVDDFSLVDLPHHYLDLFKLYDPLGGDHFNIFAAGLKTADRIVTVSHGYAWELKTPEGGWGLHGIINDNDWKLRGIVNGVDTEEWNPARDIHLTTDGYTNYSLETLKGKSRCKAALQKELGLPVRDDIPLIGFIGRLDQQKGVDLIGEAIQWMVDQDVQLVMLGTGRPDLEQMLRDSENRHRERVRGWVGFSVKMAHRITAGADVLLMPSRFEPCGLNQLYAMRYGTVPVVHAVGGLRDTVEPFDPYAETGVGWTFESADTGRLIHALGNCLCTYREYKKSWEGLQERGMTRDLSWDKAAENYEEVLVAAKYHW